MAGKDPIAAAMAAFEAAPVDDEEAKLDAIAVLEDRDDPRVLNFFLEKVADPAELDLARVEICDILSMRRDDELSVCERIVTTLAGVIRDDDNNDVRAHAADALWRHLDVKGARKALDAVLQNRDEPRNVRHGALSAIERAGNQPKSRAVLVQLEVDPDLGRSVRRILGEWETDPEDDE